MDEYSFIYYQSTSNRQEALSVDLRHGHGDWDTDSTPV